MNKPIKTITLEFYRAGDVMPSYDATIIAHRRSNVDNEFWVSRVYMSLDLKPNDLWACWPEAKELEDE